VLERLGVLRPEGNREGNRVGNTGKGGNSARGGLWKKGKANI